MTLPGAVSDPEVLAAFEEALMLEKHHLQWRPDLMWQQLYNRLQWEEGTTRSVLHNALERRAASRGDAWLRSRTPPRESGALVMTLTGHSGAVNACAVTPDGSRIVSAGKDGTVRVWDASAGVERLVLAGHTGAVNACVVAPDGSCIVSAGEDGTIRVWDAGTGVQRRALSGHDGPVRSCVIAPDGSRIVSGGDDGTLKVWDLASGAKPTTLRPQAQRKDARGLLGRLTARLSGSSESDDSLPGRDAYPIKRLAISPGGSWIVSQTGTRALTVWDTASGRVRSTVDLSGFAGWVADCAVTPDGHAIVSANASDPDGWQIDNSVRVWRTGCDEPIHITNYDHPLTSCAVSPDSRLIVFAGANGALAVWDLAAGARRSRFRGHADQVTDCVVAPDGRTIVSAGVDGTIKIWDVSKSDDDADQPGHGDWVNDCAVGPDGRFAVSVGWDETAKLWDPESGIESATLSGHTRAVYSCAIAPDATWMVTASGGEEWDDRIPDRNLRLWAISAATGRPANLAVIEDGHNRWVNGCVVSPDGALIVTASEDGTMKVWDVATRRDIVALVGHTGGVLGCAMSPDASFVVSAGRDSTLRIWDTATWRTRATLLGHAGAVNGCAVSPDGAWIVSAGADGTLRVWDSGGSTEPRLLLGDGPFGSCAVSPDGAWIAAVGSSGDLLEVWDAMAGAKLATFPLSDGWRCVAFHPREPMIIGGGVGGTLSFLDVVGMEYGPLVVTAIGSAEGPALRCPRCFRAHPVQETWLGETVPCPSCGRALRVDRSVARALGP